MARSVAHIAETPGWSAGHEFEHRVKVLFLQSLCQLIYASFLLTYIHTYIRTYRDTVDRETS